MLHQAAVAPRRAPSPRRTLSARSCCAAELAGAEPDILSARSGANRGLADRSRARGQRVYRDCRSDL